MAANNNSFGQGYGNPPMPQYQNLGYPPHPMVAIPVQGPVYNTQQQQQQQQFQMQSQPLPPMQGYPPGGLAQMQPQYAGYPPIPQQHQQQQRMQYQQQYQQQYMQQQQQRQQQQYQQQINLQASHVNQTMPIAALQSSQFDGPLDVPRPRKQSNPQRPESRPSQPAQGVPSLYQSNDSPMQPPRPRQQFQPPTPIAGSPPMRPPSVTPRQPSTVSKVSSVGPGPGPSPSPRAPASNAIRVPTATVTQPSQQSDLPVDLQVLLLGLADEYISSAHGMTASLVRNMQEADVAQYHKLIASGLGCIESVLRNFKFPSPKMEARLVHRYCSLLFEETENDDVAHEFLSRAVKMCERHKLVDLRYSLIHLQLRFHFRSRPTAALKMLDSLLSVIEAYKQTSWNYAMRFLRVTLSLQMPQPDITAALQQLRRISSIAESNRHVPICATSAALEALVHLRSDGVEAVQSAQRALAQARMHQLNPLLSGIPQLAALLDCLDLCCDLISFNPEQSILKMKKMQKIMDDANSDKSWRRDGSFCVPVGEDAGAESDVCADSGGIFERTLSGQRALVFRWIRRSELFSLGYFFSGVTTAHKNSVDRKAERYLEEGSKTCTDKYNPPDEQGLQSLNAACAQSERRSHFHKAMLLHLVLVRCNRSDWTSAKQALEPFIQRLGPTARQSTSDPLEQLTIYLNGVIKQGTGDLPGALSNFQCPLLSLQPPYKPNLNNNNSSSGGILQDLRLLSALNTILITRTDPSQQSHIQTSLLPYLESTCSNHPNPSFSAAYNLVAVSSIPHLPIIKTKSLLSTAMATAKKTANTHLICVTMNLMNATFFRDIVGERAESSARVGQTLAKRCASPLWLAVASGMLARTSEVCGLGEGMVEARGEGVRAMGMLTEGLRDKFH